VREKLENMIKNIIIIEQIAVILFYPWGWWLCRFWFD